MYDIIIFDLDDTLYRNSNYSNRLTELTKRWLEDGLGVCRPAVDMLYQWLPQVYPNPYDGFSTLGLTVEEYFENVFHQADPHKAIEPNPELEQLCMNTRANMVVVSLGPHTYCKQVLDALGVQEEVDAIYNPYQDADSHEKFDVYVRFSELRTLVVGDSYITDLQPATKLGFDTVHVAPECELSRNHVCVDDVSRIRIYLNENG